MPPTERQPGTNRVAPDPAASYGREKPEAEAGMGRLDNNAATPTPRDHNPDQAVHNRQHPHQINAHDDLAEQDRTKLASQPLEANPDQPSHSLHDEEPRGEDLAPSDIHNPEQKRHPRTEGKGGTP